MIENKDLYSKTDFQVLKLSNDQSENEIRQLIQNQLNNPYLSLNCNLDLPKSQVLNNFIRQLQKLKGLDLIFEEYSLQSFEPLSVIGESIGFLKSLHQLSLSLSLQYSHQLDNYLNNFGQSLSNLDNLQQLSLNLKILNLEGSQALDKGISNLKMLNSLKIEIVFFENQFNKDILQNILNPIKIQKNLQNLDLNLRIYEEIVGNSLGIVSKSFQNLPNISVLSFSINDKNNITNEGLEQLKKSILSLPKLKCLNLDLNLSDDRNEPKPLIFILDDLLIHSKLEEFNASYVIIYKQIQERFNFGFQIKQQSNLKKIKLSLDNHSLSKNIFNFDQNLQYLKNLNYLDLQLLQISLEGIDNLGKMIINNNQLQEIKLQFDTKINDQQIKQITDSLSNLLLLKSISLRFQSFNQNPYNILFNGVSQLQQLEVLELSFSLISENIPSIQNCFLKQNHLKKILLKCYISEQAQQNTNMVISSLLNQKSLEYLKLELYFLSKINHLEQLRNNLINLQNLTCKDISFYEDDILIYSDQYQN